MAHDSIKPQESTPPIHGLETGPNFGTNSSELHQVSTKPNYQETNASQPQAEALAVVKLRDKLTDLVQLLGSSGVLLSQTQNQPNPVLGSGQPVSRGLELHIPCHSGNTNPSTAETSLKSNMAWVPSLIYKNKYFCHCGIIISCMAVKFCTSKVFQP